ncbi:MULTISPECIES: UxaA family hydrolase [unclassified Pseudomonas]|uniref:UxaA family hydrolase n=1 Tax=unclassified Pseudomonas TaxID=196821 RepID=UPI00088670F1|nr:MULTISPECIES: UxaA family hydrolase [unclassified Pseudomonas]SCX96230.1 SAF domain-containing protein [Pseudomonas sp. NFACC37-1]SFN78823.1 SAF domain-containing protein [Pseudomonas sp. NFACC24-1]
MMQRRATPGDDVAVARGDIAEGQPVSADGISLVARQAIPSGHKIALRPVLAGQRVLKYGQATQAIEPGDHVHVNNLDMPANTTEHSVRNVYAPTSLSENPATFEGYVREDGRVGTRNYIGVISNVNCSLPQFDRWCTSILRPVQVSCGSELARDGGSTHHRCHRQAPPACQT